MNLNLWVLQSKGRESSDVAALGLNILYVVDGLIRLMEGENTGLINIADPCWIFLGCREPSKRNNRSLLWRSWNYKLGCFAFQLQFSASSPVQRITQKCRVVQMLEAEVMTQVQMISPTPAQSDVVTYNFYGSWERELSRVVLLEIRIFFLLFFCCTQFILFFVVESVNG